MPAHVQKPEFDLFPFPRFILVNASEQAADIIHKRDFDPSSESESEQLLLLRRLSEIHCLARCVKKNLMIDDRKVFRNFSYKAESALPDVVITHFAVHIHNRARLQDFPGSEIPAQGNRDGELQDQVLPTPRKA